MAVFEDVTLTWKGDEYTVPSNRVMGLIATIEDHISIAQLYRDGGPPLSKLASAYASALKYAGCRVSNEDVYASCFQDGQRIIPELVAGLLSMMIPPSVLQQPADTNTKKKTPRAKA